MDGCHRHCRCLLRPCGCFLSSPSLCISSDSEVFFAILRNPFAVILQREHQDSTLLLIHSLQKIGGVLSSTDGSAMLHCIFLLSDTGYEFSTCDIVNVFLDVLVFSCTTILTGVVGGSQPRLL